MDRSTALGDFYDAHRKASLKTIMSRITGESVDLLSYDEVLTKLRIRGQVQRGVKEIPLDSIVGSVGRYTDFTRDFLPRKISDSSRWAQVRMATESMRGVPPIEVYQIGEAYFVKDGNHRVSIARQYGQETIEAHVIEVMTRVPITPDIQPDELIIKEEYANFLEYTQLDQYFPGVNLDVTAPGMYDKLLDHISVHRYFMGIDEDREIPYDEAVKHWYENIYLPVVELIRERGILREFPDRTETDLYLWMLEYRTELEEELGWSIETEKAAESLINRFSNRTKYALRRFWRWLTDLLTPDTLESGPRTGKWRKTSLRKRKGQTPFRNILIGLQDNPGSREALEQALWIAQCEGSRLLGIHLVDSEKAKEDEKVTQIRDHFQWRLGEIGLEGNFAVEVGSASRRIVARAEFADLVVVNLEHAPGTQMFTKLRSGMRVLIRRCGQPLLVVPRKMRPFRKVLLAFDGTPKSREALFLTTFLVKKWDLDLTLLTVFRSENGTSQLEKAFDFARRYLHYHGIWGQEITRVGLTGETILSVAKEKKIDLILLGSYGSSPLHEVVWGSAIDYVLEQVTCPVLIVR